MREKIEEAIEEFGEAELVAAAEEHNCYFVAINGESVEIVNHPVPAAERGIPFGSSRMIEKSILIFVSNSSKIDRYPFPPKMRFLVRRISGCQ